MDQAAKKDQEHNYRPNHVTRAFQVIAGHQGKLEETGLSRNDEANPSVRREPEIDCMTLIQLPASDIKRMVHFYVHVLGFELDYPDRPIESNSFISTAPRIGPGLHLLATPPSEFRHLHASGNGILREYVSVYVKSIIELQTRLLEAGAQIVSGPNNGYMSFLDSEGHLIGVYERTDPSINEQFQSNITGFRHVQVQTVNMDITAEYFIDAFGFEAIEPGDTVPGERFLRIRDGGANQPFVRLLQVPEGAYQPTHWILDGRPKHALELHSKSIQALRDTLHAGHATVIEEMEFTACGGYLKLFTPDGHYIWVNQDREYCDY